MSSTSDTDDGQSSSENNGNNVYATRFGFLRSGAIPISGDPVEMFDRLFASEDEHDDDDDDSEDENDNGITVDGASDNQNQEHDVMGIIEETFNNFFGNLDHSHSKKKATKNAISQLRTVDVSKLEDSEKNCSICYEPYEELPRTASTEDEDFFKDKLHKKIELVKEWPDDPPIWFPLDETGKGHSEYSRLFKDDDSKSLHSKDSHIAVEMPCGHIFGRSCLIEWLKDSTSCPLCREEVESEVTDPHSSINRSNNHEFERIPRVFCPADWSNRELTSQDPALPFPPNTVTSAPSLPLNFSQFSNSLGNFIVSHR